MFGSETLEVAIGIVFLYLLLSLICSVLNEWVAGILAMRSNTLEAGIRNLLDDRDGKGLAKDLYDHPLIKGLARQGSKPSYIPARTFALALMDIVAPAGSAAGHKALKDVRDAVAKLQESEVKKALLTLIDEAGDDLKKARENVESWFNDAMDRVSGWYKRKAQLLVLFWALVVTLPLNADTLMIANSLWRDGTMRASIVAAAQEAAKQPLPTGSAPSLTSLEQLQAEVQKLHVPIGWSRVSGDPRAVPGNPPGWFIKIVGLLFTTVAVSLGAPFWFEVLNKFVSLRSAGKPPARMP